MRQIVEARAFVVALIAFIVLLYALPEIITVHVIDKIETLPTSPKTFEYAKEEISFIRFRIATSFAVLGFIVFLAFKVENFTLLRNDHLDYFVALSLLLCMAAISVDITAIHNLHFFMWKDIRFDITRIFTWLTITAELFILLSVGIIVWVVVVRIYEKEVVVND